MSRVSLLLPNRNNDPILDLVLERLARNTTYPDVEVVAVDDGSTDSSREILRRWRDSGRFPAFTLLERPHSGVVDTLNAALAAATGDVCVQLDADASIETPGWIEHMRALLDSDARVGAVTAKVVMDNGDLHALGIDVISPAGLCDRPATITEPVGRRRRHSRIARVREGAAPEIEGRAAEVDCGIGVCLMYRRADALAVGGYDPGFAPVWFDDADLCLSLRANGKKIFYVPDVRAVHHIGKRGKPQGSKLTARRLARGLYWRAGAKLPPAWRSRLEQRGLDFDHQYTPEQRARLAHHYAYWESKWGWDPLNPDMAEIQRRWGSTELCWATDARRRAAGEEILAAYGAR